MARSLVDRWSRDNLGDQAALLSYYFLFAIFPLLLFLTALLGFFVAPGSGLHRSIAQYLGQMLPGSASALVESTLEDIAKGSSTEKLSVGLLVALWSASSGMGAIIRGVNQAYVGPANRPWWREKILSIGLTVAVAFLMVVALLLVIVGGELSSVLAMRYGWGREFTLAWSVGQWLLLLMFVLSAFGLIYYFAPNVHPDRLRRLAPGAFVGVGMWLIVSLMFRYYVRHFGNYSVAYGAIGAVIVLMLWFYLSSLAILIGGEVNCILEDVFEDARAVKSDQ
jgi:membrane protein